MLIFIKIKNISQLYMSYFELTNKNIFERINKFDKLFIELDKKIDLLMKQNELMIKQIKILETNQYAIEHQIEEHELFYEKVYHERKPYVSKRE